MGAGDRWRLPDGQEGLEIGGEGEQLLVGIISPPSWPFLMHGPRIYVRSHCTPLTSRYYGDGRIPGPDKINTADIPDALL